MATIISLANHSRRISKFFFSKPFKLKFIDSFASAEIRTQLRTFTFNSNDCRSILLHQTMTKPMSLLSTQLDQIRTISSESDDSNGMPLEFQSSHLFFFFPFFYQTVSNQSQRKLKRHPKKKINQIISHLEEISSLLPERCENTLLM